jgi:hypothetical protein
MVGRVCCSAHHLLARNAGDQPNALAIDRPWQRSSANRDVNMRFILATDWQIGATTIPVATIIDFSKPDKWTRLAKTTDGPPISARPLDQESWDFMRSIYPAHQITPGSGFTPMRTAMFDQSYVTRLMTAIDQLTSHVFPQVLLDQINGKAVSADEGAIRYHAEALRNYLKERTPDLDKLLEEKQKVRAEINQLSAERDALKKEVHDLQ